MATFNFYSCNDDDASPLLHCTFSNLGGFERSVVLLLGSIHLFTKGKTDCIIMTIKLINVLCNYVYDFDMYH